MNKRNIKNIIIATVLICTAAAVAAVLFYGGVNIGTDRQFVWNPSIVDKSKTTATQVYLSPERQNTVFTSDREWEAGAADGFNIVDTGSGYRMYYMVHRSAEDAMVCCADSADGITWTKPGLGIAGYRGSEDTNIILGADEQIRG